MLTNYMLDIGTRQMIITNDEKLKCVERELRFRKRVYPRWVEMGRMKLDQSEYELAVMQAIVDDYLQKARRK